MKSEFNKNDYKKLHEVVLNSIIDNSKTEESYLLLSGGVDSCVPLFALLENGKKFDVVNFSVKGFNSTDTYTVKYLQKKIGFNALYVELPNTYNEIMKTLPKAINLCKEKYGKIRKVKVETTWALMLANDVMNKQQDIWSGNGGDNIVGYHRNDAIAISKLGNEHPEAKKRRVGTICDNEFTQIFGKKLKSPYMDKNVQNFMLEFTVGACNKKFPKSCFYMAFLDDFKKYRCYRQPTPFQKAGQIAALFEGIARERNYKNALDMFKKVGG